MVVYAPLIVGVVGEPDLHGKDAVVAKAFGELFDLLDKEFSHTPKILLTSLAKGADTIAADVALDRADHTASPPGCVWQVVAVLPMAQNQFEQGFDGADLTKLRYLCARLKPEPLDALHRPGPTSRFAFGSQFAWTELDGGKDNPDRTPHCEQLKLHISDQCGLLIVVMPCAEKPGATGGTARILDYRVRAELDEAGRDIVRRSEVLARLPLDRSQPGPAWVIDLDRLGPAEQTQLGAVELWEPVTRRDYEESRAIEPASEPAKHPVAIYKMPLTLNGSDFERLWLATALDTFNEKVWHWTRGGREARPENRSASETLRELRDELSDMQESEKKHLMRTAFWLAALFVLAIVVLEVHVEFKDYSVSPWTIGAYVALFIAILGLYGYARWQRYQQYTEDYRAVAEALRVQLVWWDEGLRGREHRVDRTYLGATAGSLGRVRTAVRHLIDSAVLTASAPRPAPGAAKDWIDEQISYFTDRIGKRHKRVSFVEDVSWFLFVGSLGIALFVAALTLCKDQTMEAAQNIRWTQAGRSIFDSLLIAGGLFFVHRGLELARQAAFSARRRLTMTGLNMLIAVVAGLVISVGLCDAATLLDPLIHERDPQVGELAHKLTLIALLGAAALAGAIRFYTEKMSEEHELFSYRDALVIFRRAQEDLNDLENDGSSAAKDRRNEILLAIGKKALEENEAWIRAHRLRPLEPVVGG